MATVDQRLWSYDLIALYKSVYYYYCYYYHLDFVDIGKIPYKKDAGPEEVLVFRHYNADEVWCIFSGSAFDSCSIAECTLVDKTYCFSMMFHLCLNEKNKNWFSAPDMISVVCLWGLWGSEFSDYCLVVDNKFVMLRLCGFHNLRVVCSFNIFQSRSVGFCWYFLFFL